MIRLLGVAAFLLSSWTVLASGAEARERFTVAGWVGGSYPRTGRFSHCAVTRQFSRSFYIYFQLSRGGHFSLTFYDRNGGFRRGRGFSVSFSIDHGAVDWAQAYVVDRYRVRFTLPATNATYRRFRMGHVLRFRAGKSTIPVSLRGTSAALLRMRQCVVNRLDVEAGRAPRYLTRRPSVPAQQPLQGRGKMTARVRARDAGTRDNGGRNGRQGSDRDAVSDSNRRVEAVTYAANLLAKAGFRNYRILQQSEMRKLAGNRFDVVWRTAASVGALRIYAGKQAKDFDTLAARAIVSGTRACKGGFRSGVKREANSPVVRFFTQCDGDDGWQALYAIVRGKGGKAYLIVSLGNGITDKDDGIALREVDNRLVRAMTGGPLQ